MWCMWVQGTTLEMREQLHWVSAWQTCHNSHTLTWVVSVCIDVCYLMYVMSYWFVVWVQTMKLDMREQMHWVSACHTWYNLHTLTWVVSMCIDALLGVCVCVCDATFMCVMRVQGITLELREWLHLVSTWHIWHNSHICTCVVSVCIDVCYLMWCVMSRWCVCDMYCGHRLRHWRWGSNYTESVLVTFDTTHTPWLEWVCALMCDTWCMYVMSHWCFTWCVCVSSTDSVHLFPHIQSCCL